VGDTPYVRHDGILIEFTIPQELMQYVEDVTRFYGLWRYLSRFEDVVPVFVPEGSTKISFVPRRLPQEEIVSNPDYEREYYDGTFMWAYNPSPGDSNDQQRYLPKPEPVYNYNFYQPQGGYINPHIYLRNYPTYTPPESVWDFTGIDNPFEDSQYIPESTPSFDPAPLIEQFDQALEEMYRDAVVSINLLDSGVVQMPEGWEVQLPGDPGSVEGVIPDKGDWWTRIPGNENLPPR
jgi:hypothetical protein